MVQVFAKSPTIKLDVLAAKRWRRKFKENINYISVRWPSSMESIIGRAPSGFREYDQ